MDQFDRSCDSNGVLEKTALWNLPNFTIEAQQASSNSFIFPIGVSREDHERRRDGADKISTDIEAANHLLKLFVTNTNTAKSISEIGRLETCPTSLWYSLHMPSASRRSDLEVHIPINDLRKHSSTGYRLLFAVDCECSEGYSWDPIWESSLSIRITFSANSTDKSKSHDDLRDGRQGLAFKRLGAAVETVGNVADNEKQRPLKLVSQKDFPPEQDCESIIVGHGWNKEWRLRLASDHTMDQRMFTSTELATIKEINH